MEASKEMHRVVFTVTKTNGEKANIAGVVAGILKEESIKEAAKVINDICAPVKDSIKSIKLKSFKRIKHDFIMIHKDSSIAEQFKDPSMNYGGKEASERLRNEGPEAFMNKENNGPTLRGFLEFMKMMVEEKKANPSKFEEKIAAARACKEAMNAQAKEKAECQEANSKPDDFIDSVKYQAEKAREASNRDTTTNL